MSRAFTFTPSVCLVLVVAGCASIAHQRQQEVIQQADQIAHACRAKRLSGELSGHVASAQCSTGPARQVIAASGYPYINLMEVFLAYRMAAAQRVDAGALTESEANLLLTELRSRLVSEEQRRNLMSQQAYNQQLHSYGMMLQGLAAWNQAMTPPLPVGQITCWQTGNMVTCR